MKLALHFNRVAEEPLSLGVGNISAPVSVIRGDIGFLDT